MHSLWLNLRSWVEEGIINNLSKSSIAMPGLQHLGPNSTNIFQVWPWASHFHVPDFFNISHILACVILIPLDKLVIIVILKMGNGSTARNQSILPKLLKSWRCQMCTKLLQSCPLFATLWTKAPDSSAHSSPGKNIWRDSELPFLFSRIFPSRDEPVSYIPWIGKRVLYH